MNRFFTLFVFAAVFCGAGRAQETIQYISYYPTPYASYNTINAGEVYVSTAANSGQGQISANNLQLSAVHVTGDLNMVYFSVINVPAVSVGGYIPAGSSGYGGGNANIGTLRVAGPLSLPSTILGKTSAAELHLIDGPVWGANIMPSPNAAKSANFVPDANGKAYGMIWKQIKYLDTSNNQQTATFLAINDGGQAATPACAGWNPAAAATVCCPTGTNYFLSGACGTCVTSPNTSTPNNPIPNATGCTCKASGVTTANAPLLPSVWNAASNTCDCQAGAVPTGDGNCCASPNTVFSNGHCCPSGQTWNNATSQCAAPCAGWIPTSAPTVCCPSGTNYYSGACGTCSGGATPNASIPNATSCSCPGGQTWNGSSCTCPSGEIFWASDNACVSCDFTPPVYQGGYYQAGTKHNGCGICASGYRSYLLGDYWQCCPNSYPEYINYVCQPCPSDRPNNLDGWCCPTTTFDINTCS